MNEGMINMMKLADRYVGVPVLHGLKLLQPVLSRRPVDPSSPVRTILMVKLWGIGNLVMIIPLIRAVRTAHPEASLWFLTLESNRKLLEHVPELDGLITFRPGGLLRSLFKLCALSFKLRRMRPDLVLDFEQFLRATPILASLSGAYQTVGFKTEGQARSALYNVKVPYRRERHMSLTFGDIVRSAGVETRGPVPVAVPRSRAAAERVRAFRQTLPRGQGPLVALHPGSGDNFPARRWPVENFARLAERLVRTHRARCIITGTEPERDLGVRMEEAAAVPLVNAIGRFDIMEFIEFLAGMDLLVTNDTAPAHIGSALDIPLIAFYGPNTPDLYGPLNLRSRVFYNRLPCSPCLTNLNAKTSRCRIPSCILGIDPSEVFGAAETLIKEGEERAVERAREGSR